VGKDFSFPPFMHTSNGVFASSAAMRGGQKKGILPTLRITTYFIFFHAIMPHDFKGVAWKL
jgi:hypothetical protein